MTEFMEIITTVETLTSMVAAEGWTVATRNTLSGVWQETDKALIHNLLFTQPQLEEPKDYRGNVLTVKICIEDKHIHID